MTTPTKALDGVVRRTGQGSKDSLTMGARAQSVSDPSVTHYVAAYRSPTGHVQTHCTCQGFQHNARCWHVRELRRIMADEPNKGDAA